MVLKIISPLVILFLSTAVLAFSSGEYFKSSIDSIPKKMRHQMQKSTWHQGCPVGLDDLAYIKLSYWGYDNKTHTGVLIVNKKLAREVIEIFNVLYLNHFPIQKMLPMAFFDNNDRMSMLANNTSSFSCREVTGQPGLFSQHSYGRAIDINPLINPYVKGATVLPSQARQYANRKKPYPGKITKNNLIYNEFIKRGWDWGGSWYDVQDYQHFEKRANGERRNPYGYGPCSKKF